MELIFDKTKKIFLIIFTLFLNLLMISPALASSTNYVPLVNVPGVNSDAGVLTYLSGLYNFLISVVGILAMAVIIYGGLRYLTSAGNPGATGEAKDAITSAIIGLLLALASWVILSTINPDILVLKPIGVGLSGGKYGYAAARSIQNCVVTPNGIGTSINPCYCVDNPKQPVTFTQTPPPPGPYVVSTSITPCSTTVPTNTSSITITFSQAIDPATVTLANINTFFPGAPPVSISLTSSDTATITIGAPYLAASSPQEVIVTTGVKNTTGIALASSYDLRFTTPGGIFGGPCTPPTPVVADCPVACSNPGTLGLNPPGYHCLKADIRIGTTAHPVSKEISIKADDKVYFDARSFSADYAYPSLNLSADPYISGSGFDNGIDRYEINFSAPIIGLPVADYGASDGTSCSFLWGALGAINSFWGVAGITDTTQGDLIPLYPYSSTGKYEVKLLVQNKNGCYEAVDKAYVNVNP